jgi:hypothetical protein
MNTELVLNFTTNIIKKILIFKSSFVLNNQDMIFIKNNFRKMNSKLVKNFLFEILNINILKELSNIGKPILLLRPKKDNLVNNSLIDKISNLNIESHLIQNKTHLIINDKHTITARIIDKFIV